MEILNMIEVAVLHEQACSMSFLICKRFGDQHAR